MKDQYVFLRNTVYIASKKIYGFNSFLFSFSIYGISGKFWQAVVLARSPDLKK